MRELYMKQKIMSMRGKFTVKNADEQDVYFVEGSFMRVPKAFVIEDVERQQIARITKKLFSFLPTFYIEADGDDMLTIKKDFTFFKARYTIKGAGIEIQGNWWDMNFEVLQNGQLIGMVDKKWISWGDSYRLQIVQEEHEKIIVALVVAIDYVKASQTAASAASM